MSITVNWAVTYMNCYPQEAGESEVVFQVGWSCNASAPTGVVNPAGDSVYYASSAIGEVNVTYVPGQPFTPYNQLTQQQVLGWVWGQVDQAAVEATVTAQVQSQIDKPVVTPPLPWAPAQA